MTTSAAMIPGDEKPPTKSRGKRPRARPGLRGSRRAQPQRIDRRETHQLPCCPDGGGRLKRTGDTRERGVGDAIRWCRMRSEFDENTDRSRRDRLHKRLKELIDAPGDDAQAKRLLKRLRRHQGDLFAFVDHDNVPCDNNHAERTIRPAVIIRKNSDGNRGRHGADCQSLLMSLVQTRKQRGHEPIQTICQSIATYLKTGQLPPLPGKAGSDG
jgi:Transposase IS66 family